MDVKFIGMGTDEDTTRVLQGIILNHLRKNGVISTKNNIDNSKSIFELTK